MNQSLSFKGEGKRMLTEKKLGVFYQAELFNRKGGGQPFEGRRNYGCLVCVFLSSFILHRFDQWRNTMAQNGEDNNGNRSDRQMAPVSSQFCKQMFFSAGYSISLSPGTLKREYKDSLGRVEILHINCAKYPSLPMEEDKYSG